MSTNYAVLSPLKLDCSDRGVRMWAEWGKSFPQFQSLWDCQLLQALWRDEDSELQILGGADQAK